MGYIHVEWARDVDGLDHNEKMVLMLLTLRADNQNGETFVSVRRLAQEGGYSPSSKNTVRRALRSLKDKQLIDWKGRVRPGTSEQTTHKYTVHFNQVGAESNHLGADSNNVGAESNTKNREPNQEPNKSLDTPSSSDAAIDDSPRNSADAGNTIGENADPVGPDWYNSEERKDALDYMQTLGLFKARGMDSAYNDNIHILADHLNKHLDSGYEGFDLLYDYWDIPAGCADRKNAAVKLNQLISTVKRDDGPLTYKPQEHK